MWGSTFEGVSFKKADLRSAALGAWHEGRGNTFASVDFSGSNLRQIACAAASFVDCDFALAKLVTIDRASTHDFQRIFNPPKTESIS